MTQRNYLQHGSRHRPEGTDPIPGVGSSAWAILSATEFTTGGGTSSTIAATDSGLVQWSSFVTSGEPGVFATHDHPVRPTYPIPPASDFHNTAGDSYLFTVKPGIIIAYLDSAWAGAPGWNIELVRTDGDSSYQGGENLGPQAWFGPAAGAGFYTWSFIRPIDNDPSDDVSTGGQGLYYVFGVQVVNNDSSSHTLDGSDNINMYVQWVPIDSPGITNVY